MAKSEAVKPEATKRQHKATYARDKRKGGYLIRVAGPHAEVFAGKEVPVTTMGGEEHKERLVGLIWTGIDKESGDRVALYMFESKPRETVEEFEF